MGQAKIVLKQDYPSIGRAGEVVTVAGGYARNFLIPRGFAVLATKGALVQAQLWQKQAAERDEKAKGEAAGVKASLEGTLLRIPAQAGPDGKLFGSVTSAQIAAAVKAATGVVVDRHNVEIAEPIRSTGVHTAEVVLHADVRALITIEVAAN